MPTITIIRSHLFDAIGKQYTDDEFDELCFEFGVEVDGICDEEIDWVDGRKEMHTVYKIDIPANRYDLLCLEGFARAIRIFLGLEKAPIFTAVPPPQANSPHHQITVEAPTGQIRPFVVCAVLRGINFTPTIYKSFIDLQEKLHQNVCRKRSYVAIGTHDLDTLQGPFRYRALPPEEIKFVPLTEDDAESGHVFEGRELLDFYRSDKQCKHLKPYTDLIYESPVYPVLYDSADRVLSLPPIINGKLSRVTLNTKNVFIECTATDLTKANIVLDTVVCMFSQYCAQPFTAEQVTVRYETTGKTDIGPRLSSRTCDAKVSTINGTIGVSLSPEEMCTLCNKMQLGPAHVVQVSDGEKGVQKPVVRATVPPTRSDVLHAVDVIEDIAIAFGYNNIEQHRAPTNTIGGPLRINQFSDLLRQEVGRAGYAEMLTHGLCSTAENFSLLRRPLGPAVSLSNPANMEYEVVRTSLLPGALKTLAFNKALSHKDGVQLFEISDVVLPELNEVGARNERRLVALHAAHSSAFETVHGLLDRVMAAAQIQPEAGYAANSLTPDEIASARRVARGGLEYSLKPSDEPCYFPGMRVDVILTTDKGGPLQNALKIGSLGVVHPEVLANFEVVYPCTVLEVNLEPIMH
jgi:phenylalanyl-tRNA synthetase beta chain